MQHAEAFAFICVNHWSYSQNIHISIYICVCNINIFTGWESKLSILFTFSLIFIQINPPLCSRQAWRGHDRLFAQWSIYNVSASEAWSYLAHLPNRWKRTPHFRLFYNTLERVGTSSIHACPSWVSAKMRKIYFTFSSVLTLICISIPVCLRARICMDLCMKILLLWGSSIVRAGRPSNQGITRPLHHSRARFSLSARSVWHHSFIPTLMMFVSIKSETICCDLSLLHDISPALLEMNKQRWAKTFVV